MSKLRLGPPSRDEAATRSLGQVKLKARNTGDLESAVIAAGYHARKRNETFYVYKSNSYMHVVWQVSNRPTDFLDPINNIGARLLSVTPQLEVFWHDLSRS